VEKKLAQTTTKIKQQYPESTVETWAEDEHRIGLQPVNRIIWVEKGQQPIANVNWRFQWLWLAGFVHPSSGETKAWIVPKLNTKVFSLLLKDFAQHFQIAQKKRVILALARASFHTSKQLEIPEGIHLVWMPPKSPELQPAERLWPLTNEAIANRTFDDLEQLEEIMVQRCRTLLQQPTLIQGLTNYHWWPEDLL
jgi:transposase